MPDAAHADAEAPAGTRRLLELRGVGKRYGGTWALEGVDLAMGAGEMHALLGANGAGKTTLLHVLGGITAPSAGEIRFDGRAVVFRSPADAARAGIALVHQELAVLAQCTVAENIWLAREPRTAWGALDRRAMRRQTVELLDTYGLPLDPDASAGSLSVAGRQLIEIARALSASTRILALDEPSAVLSMRERDRLFEIVRGLKSKGLLVLFVTHRLEEVFEITDCVTVLRNGRKVFEGQTGTTSRGELVRQMVGHAVDDREKVAPRHTGARRIAVEVRAGAAEPVRIQLQSDEIVGLGGLVGGGRTRLARRLAGLDEAAAATYRIGDEPPFTIRSAAQAIAHGIVYLTEDRKRDGLFLDLPVGSNASAASLGRIVRFGVLTHRREHASVAPTLAGLQLVAASLRMPVRGLSGGNQQKVLFGRALLAKPRILICDEPTRGVDVGAREEIYRVIESLAESGVAVVIISSDLKELLALSHRVLVVRAAHIVADLPPTAQEGDIIEAAMPVRADG